MRHTQLRHSLLPLLAALAVGCPRNDPAPSVVVEGHPLDVVLPPPPPPPPPTPPPPPPVDVVVAPPPPSPPPAPSAPVQAHVAQGPAEPAPGSLADMPSRPIVCTGDRVIYLDRVSIDNPTGPAVRATGSCAVRLSNCTLRGEVGVQASRRATVHLSRCRVTGTRASVEASDTAAVRLSGTVLFGPTQQTEHASVDATE